MAIQLKHGIHRVRDHAHPVENRDCLFSWRKVYVVSYHRYTSSVNRYELLLSALVLLTRRRRFEYERDRLTSILGASRVP